MTDTELRPMQSLAYDACMLVGMIEGLDVLNDSASLTGVPGDVVERRAANAMRPMLEATIKAAEDLQKRLDQLSDEEFKAQRREGDK